MRFFSFYNGTSNCSRGYPRLKILRKRPRESTDLEEYIFIEPKKICQLQKFKKLWRAPFGEKREDFFLNRNMLDPGIWLIEIRQIRLNHF